MPNAMSLSEHCEECQGSMKERGHPVRKRAQQFGSGSSEYEVQRRIMRGSSAY